LRGGKVNFFQTSKKMEEKEIIADEIKKLVELSGGKIIISQGSVKESFVLMKLEDYLAEVFGKKEAERKKLDESFSEKTRAIKKNDSDLTSKELLDKINADIELLRLKSKEEEAALFFEAEEKRKEEVNYETIDSE